MAPRGASASHLRNGHLPTILTALSTTETTPPSSTPAPARSRAWLDWLFTPAYLKEAKFLRQGVRKFLHYKRDILKAEKLAEIKELQEQYEVAFQNRDRAALESLREPLTKACDRALPPPTDPAMRDWVESLVTCAVIVFAIRAYFVQPFKIPTGSMQPTLNGIIAQSIPPDQPTPNVVSQAWQLVMRGRNYVRVEAPCDGHLVSVESRSLGVFLSTSRLTFRDTAGKTHRINVWAPTTQLIGQANEDAASIDSRNSGLWFDRSGAVQIAPGSREGRVIVNRPLPVKKGQVLANGSIDSGDMVLVDKLSYHFRRPTRGEVFVFNTRNIPIPGADNDISQHYIKRLVGLPGDELTLPEDGGPLWVNGAEAREKGIRRVFEEKVPSETFGYHGYAKMVGAMPPPWRVVNADPTDHPRGYFAMGDNSYNSLDSRYWGLVPEENLVGPGLFSLWPFTTGHWGFIK